MKKYTVRELISEATTAAGMGGVEGFGWVGPLQGANKTALYRRSLWPSGKDKKNTNGKGGTVVKTPPQGYVTEGQIREWFGEVQKHKSPSYDHGKIVKIDSKCMSFPYCSQGAADKPVKLIGETAETNCDSAWEYITEMSKHAGCSPEELAKKIREKYEDSGEYLVSDGEIIEDGDLSLLSENQLNEIDMGGFRLVKQPDGRYYPHFPQQSQMNLSNAPAMNENLTTGKEKVLQILKTKISQSQYASTELTEILNMLNSNDVQLDDQESEILSNKISDISLDQLIIDPSSLDQIKNMLSSNGGANAAVKDFEDSEQDKYAASNMDDIESGQLREKDGEMKGEVNLQEMRVMMRALHSAFQNDFNDRLMSEGYLQEACSNIDEVMGDDYLVSEMFKSLMTNEKCGDKLREMYLVNKDENGKLREADDPCWDSYKQVGMKKKDGKEVPNCVPKDNIDESDIDNMNAVGDGTTEPVAGPNGAKSTYTQEEVFLIAQNAGTIVLDAKGELISLLIAYPNEVPAEKVEAIVSNYDMDVNELLGSDMGGSVSPDEIQGLSESTSHNMPMIDPNIHKENEKNADKENGEQLKDADNNQKTQEEKIDNLRNQKHSDLPDVEKIKDIKKGASPADVDLEQPNPDWEERVELEMTTGDSRERDESKVGEKANIGHGKVFGDGEDTSGEREVEKRQNRAAVRNLNRLSGKPLNEGISKLNEGGSLSYEIKWVSDGNNYAQDFATIDEVIAEYEKLAQYEPKITIKSSNGRSWSLQPISNGGDEGVTDWSLRENIVNRSLNEQLGKINKLIGIKTGHKSRHGRIR